MKKNKAQIQAGETIVVIFIFLIILAIGIIYYTQFRSQGIKEEARELKISTSTSLLSILSSVPEIKCTQKTKEEECVDTVKALALKQIITQNINYYRTVFGQRDITLEILYPKPKTKGECDIQKYKNVDYPSNCDKFIIFSSFTKTNNKNIISTPVSIYFPDTDTYGIGKLTIITYT